jgi:hypothetical protein
MRDINLRAERSRADAITTVIAGDFLHGGAASHARIFDRKGVMMATLHRCGDEGPTIFRGRVLGEAARVAGATRVVLGGLGATAGLPPLAPAPRAP